MLNGTEKLSQGQEIVMRFRSSRRKNGVFKMSALLLVEFVLLCVIGEAIARLFLPPGQANFRTAHRLILRIDDGTCINKLRISSGLGRGVIN